MLSITRIKKEVNHKIRNLAMAVAVAALVALAFPLPAYADVYGSGPYGEGTYQSTSTTSPSSSSSGGGLADTGQNMLLITSGALLAIGLGGLVVGLRRTRTRKKTLADTTKQ